MRWTIVIAASLAGLLLGGIAIAAAVAVLVQVAISLRLATRPRL
jgi:hypothetical protein